MNKIIRITFDYKDDIVQFMRADGTIRTRTFRRDHWSAVVRSIYLKIYKSDRKFYYNSYATYKRYDIPERYEFTRYAEFKRYEEIA